MLSVLTVSNNLSTSDLWLIDDSLTLWRERTIDKVRMVARVCADRERANCERAKATSWPCNAAALPLNSVC